MISRHITPCFISSYNISSRHITSYHDSVQEALFQLGSIYEHRGATDVAQLEQAAKTFEMLLNKVPGDPNLCSRLGMIYRITL